MDRDTWPQRKRMCLDGADYSDPNYVYFAALCARGLGAPFAHPALAQQVVTAIEWARAHERWLVFAYCLMPDHLHLAVTPGTVGMKLSAVFRAFKSWTARQSWEYGFCGGLWQRSWYDHIVRLEESLEKILTYILYNPMRKGLAATPEEWPYSGQPDPFNW